MKFLLAFILVSMWSFCYGETDLGYELVIGPDGTYRAVLPNSRKNIALPIKAATLDEGRRSSENAAAIYSKAIDKYQNAVRRANTIDHIESLLGLARMHNDGVRLAEARSAAEQSAKAALETSPGSVVAVSIRSDRQFSVPDNWEKYESGSYEVEKARSFSSIYDLYASVFDPPYSSIVPERDYPNERYLRSVVVAYRDKDNNIKTQNLTSADRNEYNKMELERKRKMEQEAKEQEKKKQAEYEAKLEAAKAKEKAAAEAEQKKAAERERVALETKQTEEKRWKAYEAQQKEKSEQREKERQELLEKQEESCRGSGPRNRCIIDSIDLETHDRDSDRAKHTAKCSQSVDVAPTRGPCADGNVCMYCRQVENMEHANAFFDRLSIAQKLTIKDSRTYITIPSNELHRLKVASIVSKQLGTGVGALMPRR